MELILTIFACRCDEIALWVPREQDLATVVAVDAHLEQSSHSLCNFSKCFFKKRPGSAAFPSASPGAKALIRAVLKASFLVRMRRLERCEARAESGVQDALQVYSVLFTHKLTVISLLRTLLRGEVPSKPSVTLALTLEIVAVNPGAKQPVDWRYLLPLARVRFWMMTMNEAIVWSYLDVQWLLVLSRITSVFLV